MSRPDSAVTALVALGVTMCVALGAAVAVIASSVAVPPTLDEAQPLGNVAVTEQPFADERNVDVRLTVAADLPLNAPADGVITRSACTPGRAFRSGESNVAINGEALLNLATRVPLWRDLSVGDSGDDVAALQTELARLGADVVADGVLGQGSVAFLRARLNEPNSDARTVPLRRLLWIPSPSVDITECSASTGGIAVAGTPLATVAAAPSARMLASPTDLIPGPRVLTVDGVQLDVDARGRVTSPEQLADLAATASYRSAVADGEAAPTLQGVLALAEPALVAGVPPAAVYGIDGTAGCVLESEGRARGVTIVGSQLGQTFVVIDGEVPDAVDASPPKDAPSCR